MDLKEVIKNAFTYIGKKEIHVQELAEYIKNSVADYKEEDIDALKSKINAKLAADVKCTVKGEKKDNPNSTFVKVRNGRKGFKKGVYALRVKKPVPNPLPIQPKEKNDNIGMQSKIQFKRSDDNPIILPVKTNDDVTKTHIGKGGEFAVISELIFRGFNANIMSIDDGIDIVASKEKEGKFYLIQVKTTVLTDGKFCVNISRNSYDKYNYQNMFYAIVLRIEKDNLPQNQFIIFHSHDIERLVSTGLAGNDNKYYSMTITQWEGHLYIVRKGKQDRIDYYLNNWNLIK